MPKAHSLPPPVKIMGDNPVADKVLFGFEAYADTLSGLIANRGNATPLVTGIFGPWGAGKTTLMKTIKARLDSDVLSDPSRYRRCKTVWFQAWKCNDREQILTALVEAVFKAMAADGFFSLARVKIDQVTKRFDKSTIFDAISKLAAGVDISEFFSEPALTGKLAYSETFQKFFDDLIWTFLNWRFRLTGQEKPDDKMGAMVIFIDDLDRCSAGRIVQVLETIKLYMDRCGSIFVIGACTESIQNALRLEYGPQDTRAFMEKIFQVNFRLPQIPAEDFIPLIEDTGSDQNQTQALKAHLPVLLSVLEHNPRQLKRFINNLNLLDGLLQGAAVHIGIEKVIAWAKIIHLYSDLAAELQDRPDTLLILRSHIGQLSKKFADSPVWQLSQEQLATENIPDSLIGFLQQRYLTEIVMDLDVTATELQWLCRMRTAVSTLHG